MHYLDLIAQAAVIGFAIFSLSALAALGLGVTFGRVAADADDAMFDAYLAEKYGLPSDDTFDDAAHAWIANARDAA